MPTESAAAAREKRLAKHRNGVIRAKSEFFRNSRYGLTLLQQRVIYLAILINQQRGTEYKPVTLTVKDFMDICQLSGHAQYAQLRKIAKELIEKSVEYVSKSEDGHIVIKCAPWLLEVQYETKYGTVTITLNPAIRGIFEGRPFSQTEFIYLLRFRSQYSQRVYEILKSLSFKPLVDMTVKDFRERLKISDKMYPNFGNLFIRVIKPALDDINDYTDLSVSMTEQRGRYNKVETLVFGIGIKTPEEMPNLAERYSVEKKKPLTAAEEQKLIKGLMEASGPPPIEINGKSTKKGKK